jgi:hypothetical protein
VSLRITCVPWEDQSWLTSNDKSPRPRPSCQFAATNRGYQQTRKSMEAVFGK